MTPERTQIQAGSEDDGRVQRGSGDDRRRGFTLIELLAVIAIITTLLAILVRALGRAREASRQSTCQARLGAIGKGVFAYAGDNYDRHWQATNAPLEWVGKEVDYQVNQFRAYNPYLSLAPDNSQKAGVAECPSDRGKRPTTAGRKSVDYHGTSFGTNAFAVGPPAFQFNFNAFRGSDPTLEARAMSIVRKTGKGLAHDRVHDPSRFWFAADDGAWEQLLPWSSVDVSWHMGEHMYNILFLDGHAAPTKVIKGVFDTKDCTIDPYDTRRVGGGTVSAGVGQ